MGFEQASSDNLKFKTVFATDIDKSCGYTIEMNRPNWNFFLGDITCFSGDIVLNQIAHGGKQVKW